jgi:hypothetical protein
MARRAALISKKQKTVRISRSESYLVNRKYMGDEPEFLGAMTLGEYGLALNWYNTMCDINDAREYITEYLTKRNRKAEVKLLAKLDNCWVPTTVAWRCRMLNLGYEVPPEGGFLEAKLAEALGRVAQTTEEPLEGSLSPSKRSIQDRMRERQSDIIGDIEELLDQNNNELELYDWLKAKAIPATYCQAIVDHYSPWLDELIQAYEGGDEQLKEAYSYMNRKELKDRILFFNKLIDDAQRYGNVTKKTRAPRKPRTISMDKKLKSLKYQKENNTFKIASINPEKIIGAQELWTFNTKYKIVTVFRAIDRGGLQVKGTSIIGYDEKTSLTKGTGRQSEIVLDKIQKSGKIVLKKLMEELKTDKPLQTRINENTILLKVVS